MLLDHVYIFSHALWCGSVRQRPSLRIVAASTQIVCITQLDAVGKDALRALLVAGEALPVHPFHQRFGPL